MVGEELALVDGRPQTIAEWEESGSCEHCHSFWASYIFFQNLYYVWVISKFLFLASSKQKSKIRNLHHFARWAAAMWCHTHQTHPHQLSA